DFPTLVQESGLVRAGQGLSLRLQDQADSVIWRSPDSTAQGANPVRIAVQLPDRTWWIAAEPVGGWGLTSARNRRAYWAIAGTATLLVAGLAWLLQAWQR